MRKPSSSSKGPDRRDEQNEGPFALGGTVEGIEIRRGADLVKFIRLRRILPLLGFEAGAFRGWEEAGRKFSRASASHSLPPGARWFLQSQKIRGAGGP